MVRCQTMDGNHCLIDPAQLTFRPSVYALICDGDRMVTVTLRSTCKYGLPGGAVEPHESLAAALVREVREETGLHVLVQRLIHVTETFFYYQPTDSAYHTLNFFFACQPETTMLIADHLVDDGTQPEASCPRWRACVPVPRAAFQPFFHEVLDLVFPEA